MRFSIVTIAVVDVLLLSFVFAVLSSHCNGVWPYLAHLFIALVGKVGHVKNATAIV